MGTQESNGINLHLMYDPALETKLKALFAMSTTDIINAISGDTMDRPLDATVNLDIRAVSWYLNLYPAGNNLDILIGDKRYAIYSPTQEQNQAYQSLKKATIPVVEEIASFKVAASKSLFAIASVPIEARLLSQVPLHDLTPTDSTDLGPLDILKETGKLLARIQAVTGKLPHVEGLNSFVFTPYKPTDFLQLTPPVSLEDTSTIEQIREKIQHDLNAQGPTQDSLSQLNAFLTGFKMKY